MYYMYIVCIMNLTSLNHQLDAPHLSPVVALAFDSVAVANWIGARSVNQAVTTALESVSIQRPSKSRSSIMPYIHPILYIICKELGKVNSISLSTYAFTLR